MSTNFLNACAQLRTTVVHHCRRMESKEFQSNELETNVFSIGCAILHTIPSYLECKTIH